MFEARERREGAPLHQPAFRIRIDHSLLNPSYGLLVVAIRGDDDKKRASLLRAVDSQQSLSLRFSGQPVEVSNVTDWLPVDALDHIALLQVLCRRAILIDTAHNYAVYFRGKLQLLANVLREILNTYAC